MAWSRMWEWLGADKSITWKNENEETDEQKAKDQKRKQKAEIEKLLVKKRKLNPEMQVAIKSIDARLDTLPKN